MPSEFSPRPSRRTTIALAAVALLTLLYSLIVAGQILLWLILAGGAVGLYLVWLLIVAIFRLAEAVERVATAAEVDSGIRDLSEVGPDARSRRNRGEAPADDAPDGPRVTPDSGVSDGRDDTPAGDDSDDDAAADRSADAPVGDDANDDSTSDDPDAAPTDEDRTDRD